MRGWERIERVVPTVGTEAVRVRSAIKAGHSLRAGGTGARCCEIVRTKVLAEHQKGQGSLWSQRNLYRDVIEPAREAAGVALALDDARHTFVSTLMAAGVPPPEVAAYSGHWVGELSAVAAGDNRLRSQTTLAVYTHATGQARELALDAYLRSALDAVPRLRSALGT